MNNITVYQKYFFVILALYLAFAKNIVMPTPGGIGLYLSPNIFSWLFISIVITLSLWQVSKNKIIRLNSKHYPLAFGFILLCIPAFYPQSNIYYSLPKILALGTGLIFLIALSQFKFNNYQKNFILFILLIGITIESIIGLFQYYVLLNFNIQITGYTPIGNTPYGTFTQPNVMASFMVTGIALSLYLLKATNFQLKQYTKLYYLFINFSIITSTVLVMLLQSKTGYLSLLIVLLAFIPKLINQQQHNKNICICLLLGLSLGAFSLNMDKNPNRTPVIEQDKHRLTMYLVSLEMIKEKPILGYGYGNFDKSYRETYIQNMNKGTITKPPQKALIHPHNEIFFWVVEGGLLAACGLILIFYSYLSSLKLFSIRKRLAIFGLIAPIAIHSQLEYPFYISTCLFIYFIVFYWLTIDEFNDSANQIKFNYPFAVKTIAIISLITVSAFMLTTLQTSYLMEKYKNSNYSQSHYIDQIINRVSWSDYITITLHTQNLKNGFKTRDTQKLKHYVYWGQEYVEHRPLKDIYQNMLIAIDTLDKVKDPIELSIKQQIIKDAARLHPKSH